MIQKQNQLMDRTFRQSQGNQQDMQNQIRQGAGQQQLLREVLQKFAR